MDKTKEEKPTRAVYTTLLCCSSGERRDRLLIGETAPPPTQPNPLKQSNTTLNANNYKKTILPYIVHNIHNILHTLVVKNRNRCYQNDIILKCVRVTYTYIYTL